MIRKYRTILVDPPYPMKLMGRWNRRPNRAGKLPYKTLSIKAIVQLPINDLAEISCHLWLWTTNQFLPVGFELIKAWGFKYLAPITWVKPSGCGNYFVSVTQTLLFGYKDKCIFPLARYKPTVLHTSLPKSHSEKPKEFYQLIENISPTPRLELFARNKRNGWDCWGNEVESDIDLLAYSQKAITRRKREGLDADFLAK